MRYLIDGYNLLYHLDATAGRLESSRERLIDSLCSCVDQLGLDCILVFDAGQTAGFARHHFQGLEVVYTSSGESADEYILSFLEESPSPKSITVVTSDGRLAWASRDLGAKTEKVAPFIEKLEKRLQKKERGFKEGWEPLDPSIGRYLEIFQKRFERGEG